MGRTAITVTACLLVVAIGAWSWVTQVRPDDPRAPAPSAPTDGDGVERGASPTVGGGEGRRERTGLEAAPGGEAGAGTGQATITVVDEAGSELPAARLAIVPCEVLPRDVVAQTPLLLRAIAEARYASGSLRLPGDQDQGGGVHPGGACWIVAEAEGHETALVRFEPPWRDAQVVLRRLVVATCELDAMPLPEQRVVCVAVPFAAESQKWRWGRHLNPRQGIDGWVVVADRMADVVGTRAEIGELVPAQSYAFHAADDTSKGPPQFATAPCALRFATPTSQAAVRIVFSRPLPSSGVVCWRAKGGSDGASWHARDVAGEARDAHVHLAQDHPGMQMFGIGDGWSFASPLEIVPGWAGDLLVEVVDDRDAVVLSGFQGNEVVVHEWRMQAGRATLVPVTNDPTAPGLRGWAIPQGVVLRGLRGGEHEVVFHWVDANALTSWRPSSGTARLTKPETTPVRVRSGPERDEAEALLRATASKHCRWYLEQKLRHGDAAVWWTVAGDYAAPRRTLEVVGAERRMVAAECRVRLVLDGREIVLAVD